LSKDGFNGKHAAQNERRQEQIFHFHQVPLNA
jgi:hypothetical protein